MLQVGAPSQHSRRIFHSGTRRVVWGVLVILSGVIVVGDELNEAIRKQREREEGMQRQIDDVNKPAPKKEDTSSPNVGDFLGNMKARSDAAKVRRQEQERLIQEKRDREHAEYRALAEVRQLFGELEAQARLGDETAMHTLVHYYLAGTYAGRGFPKSLPLAEHYLQMLIDQEDKPGHGGYWGLDTVKLGALRYLRGDSAGAQQTWERLLRPGRAGEETRVALVCILAMRLMESGPDRLSAVQSKIIAGLLLAQLQFTKEWLGQSAYPFEARLILDAFSIRTDLAPAPETFAPLWDYFEHYSSEPEVVSFRPVRHEPLAAVANPPVPVPVFWDDHLRAILHLLNVRNAEDLRSEMYFAYMKENLVVLRDPYGDLLAAAAEHFQLPAVEGKRLVLKWQSLVDGENSATAKEFARFDLQQRLHGWIAKMGTGSDGNAEGNEAQAMYAQIRESALPLTVEDGRVLYAVGRKWLAGPTDSSQKYAAGQLITLAALAGAAEPVDGAQAASDIEQIEKFLGEDKAAAAVALYGATHGPEKGRPAALQCLGKYDRPHALELAEPLALQGITEAAVLMSNLTYPCAESVHAMQRARRWKIAAHGEGANSTDIISIEEWLRAHDAVASSYSPELQSAIAALQVAGMPEARRAAVERLEAVVKEEYAAGSFFAYDELMRFACSPADADGQAAMFLVRLLADRDNARVAHTDECGILLEHDQAALLVRAAACGHPAAVAVFQLPTAEDVTNQISLDQVFYAVEERHRASLLALASAVEAKTGPALVAAFQRSHKEPPTLGRVVHALRAGTRHSCKALESSDTFYPFQTRCLDALIELVPQAEKDPAAWEELLTAIAEFPEAPFRWEESFGPFHARLYATYFKWKRAKATGQSGAVEVAAYCQGKSAGYLVADAFLIAQARSSEPAYPDVVYLHDREFGEEILERAIAAGFKDGEELRRRFKANEILYGKDDFDLVARGELWPLSSSAEPDKADQDSAPVAEKASL